MFGPLRFKYLEIRLQRYQVVDCSYSGCVHVEWSIPVVLSHSFEIPNATMCVLILAVEYCISFAILYNVIRCAIRIQFSEIVQAFSYTGKKLTQQLATSLAYCRYAHIRQVFGSCFISLFQLVELLSDLTKPCLISADNFSFTVICITQLPIIMYIITVHILLCIFLLQKMDHSFHFRFEQSYHIPTFISDIYKTVL